MRDSGLDGKIVVGLREACRGDKAEVVWRQGGTHELQD